MSETHDVANSGDVLLPEFIATESIISLFVSNCLGIDLSDLTKLPPKDIAKLAAKSSEDPPTKATVENDAAVVKLGGEKVPPWFINQMVLLYLSKNYTIKSTGIPAAVDQINFLDKIGFYEEKKKKARDAGEEWVAPRKQDTFACFLRNCANILNGGKIKNHRGVVFDMVIAFMNCDWMKYVVVFLANHINGISDMKTKKEYLNCELCLYICSCCINCSCS